MSATNKTAAAGITALLIVAVIFALNFLVGGVGFGNFRLDLTQDGLYTLSSGTKNILGRINAEEPVTIKFYSTNDDRVMPNLLKPHARSIEDLLLEYEKQSNGSVSLEVIHPNPDTDEEQKAKDDEIRGLTVSQAGMSWVNRVDLPTPGGQLTTRYSLCGEASSSTTLLAAWTCQ
jgi:ABC-type uncharacterized transport system involved in gliding motility auxiliary subunit